MKTIMRRMAMVIVCAVLAIGISAQTFPPAEFYWVGDVSTDWKIADNWSGTSGGPGGTGPGGLWPGQGQPLGSGTSDHLAIFDANPLAPGSNSNCTATGSNIRIGGIKMVAPYNALVDWQVNLVQISEKISGGPPADPAFEGRVESGTLRGTAAPPGSGVYNHLWDVPVVINNTAGGVYQAPFAVKFRNDVNMTGGTSAYDIITVPNAETRLHARPGTTSGFDFNVDLVEFNYFEFQATGGANSWDLQGSESFVFGDWVTSSAGLLRINNGIMHVRQDVILMNTNITGRSSINPGNPNYHGSALIWMDGTINQTIDQVASMFQGPLPYLRIDKTSGSVFVTSFPTVHGDLELLEGIVFPTTTSATDFLILETGSQVSGASDESHCDGAIMKIGNNDFEYPVGKNGEYHPVVFTNTINPDQFDDGFKIEYFETASGVLTANPILDNVINCEYWNVETFFESTATTLTSDFDIGYRLSTTCDPAYFAETCDLRTASRDVATIANWEDEGNAGTSTLFDGTGAAHNMVASVAGVVFPLTATELTFGKLTSLGISASIISPTCGNCDGQIAIGATGGTAPFQYAIDCAGTPTYQASPIFSGLCAGSYDICILDANGCTVDAIIILQDSACCFAEFDPDYVDFNTQTAGSNYVVTATEYVALPNKVFATQSILVDGGTLDITNTDLVFTTTGLTIDVINGGVLKTNNATLRPCIMDSSWVGITVQDNSTADMDETVVQNALTAVDVTSTGEVEMANNHFNNCQVSVVFNSGINTAVNHSFTGNTISVNEDHPFAASVFTGIQVNNMEVTGVISQNDLNYNSTDGILGDFTGINNNQGAVRASENTFTNIRLCYLQTGGSVPSSFENNEIDYTLDGGSIFSLNSSPIVVDGASNVVLIKGNELQTNDVVGSGTETGILMINCPNMLVTENEVRDFTIGIHAENCQGQIKNNNVENAEQIGIDLLDCTNSIATFGNTVNSDQTDAAPTIGINYTLNTAIGYNLFTVTFDDNCVLNTDFAIITTNNSATAPLGMPRINNNYCFNYDQAGLTAVDFGGPPLFFDAFFGTQNSFISNNFVGATDIVHIGAGFIFTINNFLDEGSTSAGVFGGPGAQNFEPGCGSHLRAGIMAQEAIVNYVQNQYPLEYTSGEFRLTDGFEQSLDTASSAFAMSSSMLHLLHTNNSLAKADAFVTWVSSSSLLTSDELDWLRYHHLQQQGDVAGASAMLGAISPADQDESELLEITDIITALQLSGNTVSEIANNELTALKNIDVRRGSHAAVARNTVHAAIGGHPYIFKGIDATTPMIGSEQVISEGEILMYPNPAQNQVTLAFSTQSTDGVTISIVDIQGRLVETLPTNYKAGFVNLDISTLNKGVYIVTLEDREGRIHQSKLVKQ